MKIPLSDITEGGLRKVVIDTGWSSRSGLELSESPEAELFLHRPDEVTAVLKGRLRAKVKTFCGRCGTPVDHGVDENFEYIFRLEEDSLLAQQEVELSEDDVDTVFLDEPEIDVDEVLAEQLILSVPAKLLCSEQCRGLCPGCGTPLNIEECSCAGEQSDSPFAVLKHLKK